MPRGDAMLPEAPDELGNEDDWHGGLRRFLRP
jgi:hypothetical protein